MVYLISALQWLLAAVFAVAVGSKLSRSAFGEFVISTGRLLPLSLSRWRRVVAVGVVTAEAATVVLVLLPATAMVGFVLAAGLSVTFAARVVATMRRGDRLPCRCFGASAMPISRIHLVRNAFLATFSAIGLVASRLPSPPSIHSTGVAIAAIAGVVVAVLLVRLDDLALLFGPVRDASTSNPS